MREYTISFDNQTVSGAITILFVNPPTGRAIEITRVWASQRANATSAQQGIQLGYKASVFPTLTGATPAKMKPSDPLSYIVSGTAGAAGTAGVLASVEGAGTFTPVIQDNFNVLPGYLWQPSFTGGESFILSSADSLGFAVKFSVTPGTTTGWSGGLEYREVG